MRIRFSAEGAAAPPVEAPARRGIQAVLRRRARGGGDLNVVWVSRRRLRSLGKRFRGADRFTDVISFLHEAPSFLKRGEPPPFGDLYIAPEQARINARRFGVSFKEECVRLCVHGALHLLGHRDTTGSERERMWAVQEPIVRRAAGGAVRRGRR